MVKLARSYIVGLYYIILFLKWSRVNCFGDSLLKLWLYNKFFNDNFFNLDLFLYLSCWKLKVMSLPLRWIAGLETLKEPGWELYHLKRYNILKQFVVTGTRGKKSGWWTCLVSTANKGIILCVLKIKTTIVVSVQIAGPSLHSLSYRHFFLLVFRSLPAPKRNGNRVWASHA